MARVGGIIASTNGKKVMVNDYSYNVNITLPSDREYLIGFDQSTTCTGIYICDTKMELHILFDFMKTEKDNKDFFKELKFFIRKIVKGGKFVLVLSEKPVPSKYKTAGNMLRELKGKLGEWVADTEELCMAKEDDIFPQSWKSEVVDKSKGKGRFNDKYEVAKDVVSLVPCIEAYLYRCPSKDYDSFEACGLVHGYLKSRISESGMRKIAGTVENSHHTVVFYKYLTKEEIQDKKILWDGFDFPLSKCNETYLEYNEDYSFYQNIKMASSTNEFVMTMLTKPLDVLSVMWNFMIKPASGKYMVMFIMRKKLITQAQLKYTKGRVKCYEEFQ